MIPEDGFSDVTAGHRNEPVVDECRPFRHRVAGLRFVLDGIAVASLVWSMVTHFWLWGASSTTSGLDLRAVWNQAVALTLKLGPGSQSSLNAFRTVC